MSKTKETSVDDVSVADKDISERTTEPPLGWDGKTLKELLEETEQLSEESGTYRGLDELQMKTEEPFEYEQLYSRLRGALVGARETALNISSSPIVNEIGELCFQVYTPEGDAVALSTGIIAHVHTGSTAIKYMIRNDYEHSRGFEPGDIYCNNDQEMGNVHTADIHTLIPVFRDGKLVAWVDGVNHVLEIGGITPGQAASEATCRWHDGFYVTCEKIGSNDERHQGYLERAERSTRLPDFWELDEKCRIAGCHMAREAIHEIIDDVGLETFQQFMYESIEDGRRVFKSRVQERMFPGTYREVSFHALPWGESYDNPHPRREGQWDQLLHLPIEMDIDRDGTLSLDMDGASQPGPHPGNCVPESLTAGLWVTFSQNMVYDGKVNDGSHYAMDLNFPEGTVTNPQERSLSYNTSWRTIISGFQGGWQSMSRAFFARGYREEMMAGYGPTAGGVSGHGKLATGQEWAIGSFDLSCQGSGASPVRDGLDWAYAMWNPESDMGDVEKWEFQELGAIHLSRSVKPNTAGHGKYRGGSAWEGTRTFVGNDQIVGTSGGGWGQVFWNTTGMHGGYPWATSYGLKAKDTDLFERFENKEPYTVGDVPIGSFEEDIEAETLERAKKGSTFQEGYQDGDIVHWAMLGGPGYGDPLERTVEKVTEDVEDGIYTPDVVEEVYGVVGEFDRENRDFEVDEAATEERREEILEERGERMQMFDDFYEEERERLENQELNHPAERMYKGSFKYSEDWEEEFHEYWNLSEEFEFDVELPPETGM